MLLIRCRKRISSAFGVFLPESKDSVSWNNFHCFILTWSGPQLLENQSFSHLMFFTIPFPPMFIFKNILSLWLNRKSIHVIHWHIILFNQVFKLPDNFDIFAFLNSNLSDILLISYVLWGVLENHKWSFTL